MRAGDGGAPGDRVLPGRMPAKFAKRPAVRKKWRAVTEIVQRVAAAGIGRMPVSQLETTPSDGSKMRQVTG